MFERFTTDARAVVTSAIAEAEQRGDRHIGTDHLLLGVLASPSAVTSAAVRDAGLDLAGARRAVLDADADALAAIGIDTDVLPPPGPRPPEHPATPSLRSRWRRQHRPFTGGAKHTLEGALREALQLKHRWIGTEHLLLALAARTGPDPAARLLDALGVDRAALRADIERRLAAAA